ncbi:PH domain-containing protein [Lysobacter sp. HX-5-24]|uniref:PH domain-containing protein n=2 Tax=Noviluteimonas gilva TaxID=2682097 RepID=A0A7C9HQI5_9GAMM|nr:PH domain-containing protein [Lysobacter gilvus]MUV13333.1 PH domain-containing protein [Lysobacter gilvus]
MPIDADWRPLPPRAKSLFALSHGAFGLAAGVPVAVLSYAFADRFGPVASIALPLLLWACVLAFFIWVGIKRYRSSAWRLDDDGFAYRRGRIFFRETRVPASRVQHLDLKHGPLERRWKLATLVIHTAGSKMSAVSVTGLDAEDAEVLRDRLARQLDDDDAG